ncbi:MAG: acyl-CoA reductase-like NAD-dependent aldehyde dehydrogenase [Planctomycetota bacterium]|jgi:acyl-CoA reductase-like NAD-dependent aldehyde dehydrogenase
MTNSFDVTSPFDGAVLATLKMTDGPSAEAAIARADALHRDRSLWLDAPTRIAILERFVALVSARTEEFARQAAREGGKPLKDSRIEIVRAIDGTKAAIKEISQLHGTEVPMGLDAASLHRVAHTFREPRGVVLAISAFNHPFNLIIHQAITAIAAGCPVLVKPAATTCLSALSIVDLLSEAGLPEGWCQLLLCDHGITESLVSDPRLAFMTFIGSAKVGWYLRSKLAAGATCALEHGGVAPALVDMTADIDAAIAPLTRGGFYHAGQVCVSVQRVYVHRSIAEEFAQKFVAAVEQLNTGDPLAEDTDVGPLITSKEVDRVDSWVQEALKGGAKLLIGGQRISATTYEPTILLNPSDDAKISQLEVFGPVVALYTYDDLDEAIARANALDVSFQACVFTSDLNTALGASRRLNGATVMVNDHTAFRVDWMPFGGHRQSGLGMGGIGHTMRDMTLERMIVMHSSSL